jgi:hypothetical protein
MARQHKNRYSDSLELVRPGLLNSFVALAFLLKKLPGCIAWENVYIDHRMDKCTLSPIYMRSLKSLLSEAAGKPLLENHNCYHCFM